MAIQVTAGYGREYNFMEYFIFSDVTSGLINANKKINNIIIPHSDHES
jgi:hypothetical protein